MKLTLKKKMLLSFFSVFIVLLTLLAICISQLISNDKDYTTIMNNRVQKLSLINQMIVSMNEEQKGIRGFLLYNDENNVKQYENAGNSLKQASAELEKIFIEAKDKQALTELNDLHSQYVEQSNQQIELKRQGQFTLETAATLKTTTAKIGAEFNQKATELEQSQKETMQQESDALTDKTNQMITIIIIISTIVAIASTIVGILVTRSVIQPVVALKQLAEKTAANDLTSEDLEVKTNDEIGDLVNTFNLMKNKLRSLILHAQQTAEQVASSSEQLSASAEETAATTSDMSNSIIAIAQTAEQTSENTKETVSAMEQMVVGVQKIAETTNDISDLSNETAKNSQEGKEAVEHAMEQMESIDVNVKRLADIIHSLGSYSAEIGNIIEVITNIASQTNLLSLNAAIEAARAGEHGKGFAVVADEVRKLAEQSSTSADQVAKLITSIQGQTTDAVEAMKQGTKEVQIGVDVVDKAGQSFMQIMDLINQVARQIEEVSAATQQITASVEQISASTQDVLSQTNEVSDKTHTIASASEEQHAAMEEVAKNTEHLSQLAVALQEITAKFTV